jgi:isochorismate synthase
MMMEIWSHYVNSQPFHCLKQGNMTSNLFFETLETHFNKNLPFVAFKYPNKTEIKSYLQKDDTLDITSDFTETGFVFAPFDSNETAVIFPLDICEVLLVNTVDLDENESINEIKPILSDDESKSNHIQLVKKGIITINSEGFQKIVLSRNERVQLSNSNPISIFKRLLATYNTAFVYCWFHPKVGLWLGATPETLMSIEGQRLTTMSLAGTQKYKGTLDVVWSQKEINEQQVVTDFIIKQLESLNLKPQTSNLKPETIKAGNLLHLKTSISANLNPHTSNLKQLLTSLHPTPAVCGLPKDAAKQFILKNENYDREFYTGFLGEINIKTAISRNTNARNIENNAYATVKIVSNLFVNLRCMQISNQEAKIYIGGGITKDSNAEAEWEETVQKALVMKKVLL